MRTLIKILFIACGLCAAKGADELVTNNAAIVVDTNVFCTLIINENSGCSVGLTDSINSTVGYGYLGLRLPVEKICAIDLVDAKGRSVKKTDYGKQFGQPLTQKEVRDWFSTRRRFISMAWFIIPQHSGYFQSFRISKAFKLTQAGEYTLHVRMRLIQTGVLDSSGTIRKNILDQQYLAPKSKLINFQSVWLPEVTAKIQIQSGGIPPANLPPNSKTNSQSK